MRNLFNHFLRGLLLLVPMAGAIYVVWYLYDFLDNCAALQAICHSTNDHLEAVTAMLEKRSPTFQGN